MSSDKHNPLRAAPRQRQPFAEDFTRFFLRGLEALLPTLITLFVLTWLWNQLSDKLGQHITTGLRYTSKWVALQFSDQPAGYIKLYWDSTWDGHPWLVDTLGVFLAIVLVYLVGLLVGNLIGRTLWHMAEKAVMRLPLVRAIYPAVKQIIEFLLSDRQDRFRDSRVVAVQPHEGGIWSVGLVTGPGLSALNRSPGEETLTVFVPSSPTAFSGYVLIVPKRSVVDLPMTVEQVMRLLISGGVITPEISGTDDRGSHPADGRPASVSLTKEDAPRT